MKEVFEKPEIKKLNAKETLSPTPRHKPTAWDCIDPGHPGFPIRETTASFNDELGCFKCDYCNGNQKDGTLIWIGDSPHNS